jgi:hypothetical protein
VSVTRGDETVALKERRKIPCRKLQYLLLCFELAILTEQGFGRIPSRANSQCQDFVPLECQSHIAASSGLRALTPGA